MATRTENLKLSKAETSDGIKSTLTANNQNFDKLDGVITRLRNNQLRGTASGTEIEISDAGAVESVLKISGNSEQETRSGRNKFDMFNGTLSSNATKTINGSSITISTSLETGGHSAYAYEFSVKPSTKYHISFTSTRTGNGGGGVVIEAKKKDGSFIKYLVSKKNELSIDESFTTTADTETIKVYLCLWR